jgi:chromate transporter
MIQRELVEQEKWVSPERFNRAYAVYQALPGPEAHELCVYFGTLARGRIGGLLAGLGFMLPGFVLMFALSWMYVRHGIDSPAFAAAFAGIQAAVLALIARAVHRIGKHALTDKGLFAIGLCAAAATFAGVHFAITLLLSGIAHVALLRRRPVLLTCLVAALVAAASRSLATVAEVPSAMDATAAAPPGIAELFGSGLRSGLLTFGGAYTVIPYLLHDAVDVGGWMSREQFLDGIALGGILPAPLIIFATFVGYMGGGPLGALALTTGIFLPAFGFTLVGHELFERATRAPGLQRFLAGVTAGVVGLITATAIALIPTCITGASGLVIFATGLFILYVWKSKLVIPLVVALAAAAGLVFFTS